MPPKYATQVAAMNPKDQKAAVFVTFQREQEGHKVELIDGYFRAYCKHEPRCKYVG